MYAVIELGGRQWKVEPGTRLEINRVPGDTGGHVVVERVLLAHDGKQVQVGAPFVKDAKVICEIVSHGKGPKVISYYFRRRENWRKTIGHRQFLTQLVVKTISLGGVSYEAEAKATPQPKAKAAAETPAPKRSRVTAKPRLSESKPAHKAEAKKTSAPKSAKHPKK